MIRYTYNTQKQPPAPFVRVTLRHPNTGAEVRDLPAQLDTGADRSVLPLSVASALALHQSGVMEVIGVGGNGEEMPVFDVLLGVHNLTPLRTEVLAHPGEPWVLLGRDVLNGYRAVFDGPNLILEIA